MRSHEIDYKIYGHDLQYVEIELDRGETVIAEAGAMLYMENGIDYKTNSYNGGIQGRQDFIVRSQIHVYPDTLCWIRDFTYSYNEPLTSKYFWHPGFDDYPVVGVNWKQAEAFCHWRTKIQNDFFASMGEAIVQDYRLTTVS